MGRKQYSPKRKRQDVPLQAYRFVGFLEKLLNIDQQSEEQHGSQGSHFDPRKSSNSLYFSEDNNDQSMLEATPPTTATSPPTPSNPFIGNAMEILEQGGDLDKIDQATLEKAIQPIWQSLEQLDAVSLLNLRKSTKRDGARISNGYVKNECMNRSKCSVPLFRTSNRDMRRRRKAKDLSNSPPLHSLTHMLTPF